ncbi:DUF2892 domain-containing protein [Alicyclobacillus curvatus]|nr:DUF2892 domain-containing protein [Alicyclobacillus curvatus]
MSTQPLAPSENAANYGQGSSGHFEIQPNIGKVDRYIRMTAGLFMLGSALTHRKSGFGNKALLVVGSMSLTEGILGWCPMMAMFGIRDTKGSVGEKESVAPNETSASRFGKTSSRSATEPAFDASRESSSHSSSESSSDASRESSSHPSEHAQRKLASHAREDRHGPFAGQDSKNRHEDDKWPSPSSAADYMEPTANQTEMDHEHRKDKQLEPDDVAFALNTSFQ